MTTAEIYPDVGEDVGHHAGMLHPGVGRMEENEPRLEEAGLPEDEEPGGMGRSQRRGRSMGSPVIPVWMWIGNIQVLSLEHGGQPDGHVELLEGLAVSCLGSQENPFGLVGLHRRGAETDQLAEVGLDAHKAVPPDGLLDRFLESCGGAPR